jgi:DNA-binding CsgD family transcriptional regulator
MCLLHGCAACSAGYCTRNHRVNMANSQLQGAGDFGLSIGMRCLLGVDQCYVVPVGALDRTTIKLQRAATSQPVDVHTTPLAAPQPELTERESQVLRLLSRGLQNKQIAYRLCLSEGTVKNHLSLLMRKLNARNRIEVLLRCTALGLQC